MLEPGEYTDVLRAIGWTLDQRLAEEEVARVEIAVRGSSIAVSWQTVGGAEERLRYRAADLETLRTQARALREGTAGAPGGEQAEFLRTIGQHLDEHRIRLERLVRLPEGHRIVGVLDWHSLSQWYHPTVVRDMSEERRRRRGKTDSR